MQPSLRKRLSLQRLQLDLLTVRLGWSCAEAKVDRTCAYSFSVVAHDCQRGCADAIRYVCIGPASTLTTALALPTRTANWIRLVRPRRSISVPGWSAAAALRCHQRGSRVVAGKVEHPPALLLLHG